jgi:hypothetical protein
VRRYLRAALARHENLFALLWYLHLVRNQDPGMTPWWLPPLLCLALAVTLLACCASAAVLVAFVLNT